MTRAIWPSRADGKLGGSAAAIDLQKTRAGRARRAWPSRSTRRRAAGAGCPSARSSPGPSPLKASLPLGENAPSVIRVEADLAKAGVDQLVPGWVKPAGRPAKLSASPWSTGQRARSGTCSSTAAAMQLRGHATLSNDGGLDKADLSTFKLSPGDDMRAADRALATASTRSRSGAISATPARS